MSNDFQKYLPIALEMAEEARRLALQYFRTPVAVDIKPDQSPVSQADKAIESAWRQTLKTHCPAHGILGEEFGREGITNEYVWVLDPIDGTRAFLAGMPTFGCLISLCHKGEPVIGIIEHPATEQRLVGIKGKQTTLNGAEIHTRECEHLSDATFSTTSPFLFSRPMHGVIRGIMGSMGSNVLGKDCMAYSMLAAGHVDVVIEAGLKPYDFCALAPIVEGAGGQITDWQNQRLSLQSNGSVLVTGSRALHEDLQPQLASF